MNDSQAAAQVDTEAAEAQSTEDFIGDAFETEGETADQTKDNPEPDGDSAEPGEAEDGQQEEAEMVDLAAVPETPDGYRLNLPEGQAEVTGLTSLIRAKAHAADMNQGQFDAIVEAWNEFTGGLTADQAKLAQEMEAADKAEVAKRFGVKDGDAEGLKKVFQRATDGFLAVGKSMGIDGQKIVEMLVDGGLATQPDIAALGVWLHKLTKEDGGPTPEPGEKAGPVDTATHYEGMFKE